MTRAQQNALIVILVIIVGLSTVALVFIVFTMDYLATRSAARLALALARFGPGTPLDAYVAEFGQATHHFTEPAEMREWGPSTDESLLSKAELYYFWYSGVPYRYIVVYVDKDTRRSVLVTWKDT